MKAFTDKMMAFWSELDPRRRAQLGVALVVTLAILIGVGVWSSSPSWTPVLEGRSYEELLDGAAALEQAEVRFRIKDGALQVPAPQLGSAQAAMNATGQQPGLDDVEALPVGLTPGAQSWAFLRAREGDLAQAVNSIQGVAASRVHLVPSREPLFRGEEEPARASVFVRLRPGRMLEPSQVRAITNLVSGAVEGLTSDRVAVIDDKGTLLADGEGRSEASTGSLSELLEYQIQLERRYERAVAQSLMPVLGFEGGFSATATVDVDQTSAERISEQLDPKIQALKTEQIEESSSERKEAGGVPGVDANVPERPATGAGATSQESSAISSTFEYPRVNEVIHRPPGHIQRVSVAVQVDSSKVAALAESAGLTPEQIQAEIQRTVQAAVGMDESRNDNVSVQFLPFTPVELEEAEAGMISAPLAIQSAMPYVLAALATVLTFLFVVRPLVASVTSAPSPPAEEEAPVQREGLRPEEDLATRIRHLIDGFEPVNAEDLSDLIAQQPQAAAKVLKQWQRAS